MIHVILGTRAQLIKMAPVMKELQDRGVDYNFIFLAEHKETIYSMLDMFGIKKPDYILGDLKKDVTDVLSMFIWTVNVLISAVLKKGKIFRGDRNGVVLVHGDAPPCLLGALISKFAGLKVGHVESGLRSFNLFNPFPEEIIRILTMKLTDYHFCPGDFAISNVMNSRGEKVDTKFNTLYDSLKMALESKDSEVEIPEEKYCIATIHRFENIFNKKRFFEIVDILKNISKSMKILFILHPPTKKQLEKFGLMKELSEKIEIRPRYEYYTFIKLLNRAEFVVSDGGSNQEECYYLGKPCLLLRKTTEREEGIGKNVVISKFDGRVINEFLENYTKYRTKRLTTDISPSKIIVDYLQTIS